MIPHYSLFIEAVSLTALRCAGYLLTTNTRKKEEKGKPSQENEAADDIPFLMKEIMVCINCCLNVL